MPFFSNDNTDFYYESQGKGTPLFFLHGLGGDIAQPFETLAGLEGFQIYSMESRGHGNTQFDKDVSKLNFDTLANDFLAFANHLNIETFILGGISMGAGISLNFSLKHPQRVSKLILHRPAWLNQPLPAYLKMVHEMACQIELKGVDAAIDFIYQSEDFNNMQKNAPEAAESLKGLWENPKLETFSPLLKHIPASTPFQHFEDLKNIQCPTLVIGTSEDPIHPLEFAKTLTENIPGAIFKETAPRYIVPEKHQKEVVEAVQKFLDS